MRHRVKGRKLGRTASHRLATMRSLATALFLHKKIVTTLAKAKHARTFIEPMITKAKADTVHARRLVEVHIKDKEAFKELFGDIIQKVGDRPGGYTRIIKLGQRRGDAAEMAILELVDYSDIVEKEKPRKKVVKEKAETVEEANVVEETTETVEASEEVAEEAAPETEATEEPAAEETVEENAETEETPAEEAEPKAEEKKEETSDKNEDEKKDN
ncbi:MAG: 50S ribosomal protein L17 [Chlorobi bacterium]|nr:50S ribosomal protein L17 [Chlorobiota bacterium]